MKRILIAAAIAAAGVANAGTIFTMPNESGGAIQLTDGTSQRCEQLERDTKRSWQYAVAVGRDGFATKGCWNYNADDNQFEVSWSMTNNYQTRLYPGASFTLTNYAERTYPGNNRNTRGAL